MVDTVTPPTPMHNPKEMSAFGWIILFGIALVLLPLWPFIAIIWIAGKMGSPGKERGRKHPADEPPV